MITLQDVISEIDTHQCDDLVRIGSRFDGGYVHSLKVISSADALLSFGVETNWDFEKDFQQITRCRAVDAYDNSIDKSTLLRMIGEASRQQFRPWLGKKGGEDRPLYKAVAKYADFCDFFAAPNRFFRKTMASRSGDQYCTLSEALAQLLETGSGAIFLKCDIEGAEYELIDDIVKSASHFVGLTIEFHDVGKQPDRFLSALGRIKKKFLSLHYHVNNAGGTNRTNAIPEIFEISFVSRSYESDFQRPSSRSYPVLGLDWPNVSEMRAPH